MMPWVFAAAAAGYLCTVLAIAILDDRRHQRGLARSMRQLDEVLAGKLRVMTERRRQIRLYSPPAGVIKTGGFAFLVVPAREEEELS